MDIFKWGLIILLHVCYAPIIHEIYCPEKCRCTDDEADCKSKDLHSIPPAPVKVKFSKLDLSYNKFDILRNNSFVGYENIFHLKLVSCQISEIASEAFREIKSLKTVDLSHNNLEILPDGLFSENVELENVSISDNRITILPAIYVSLKYLDASRNRISEFPIGINLTTNSLDLSFNTLHQVPPNAVESLSRISSINLNDNKLICGSKFKDLQCWMHRYNKSSTPQKLLECYLSTNKDETPYTVSEIWLKAHCNYNSKITITYSELGDSQNTMESSTETSQYSESDDSIFGELDQPTTPDTAEASSTSEDPVNEDRRNLIFNIKSLIFVCFVILLIGLYVLWYKKKYPKQFEKVECQDNENYSGSQTDIMPS